ncbi:aminomethyl-transferring glycine dehydrogenase subunit GcvPB, partial [Desulfovibrio sp. 1214_IL3152]
VSECLLPFLPAPRVRKREDASYFLDYDVPQSIGYMGPFYGSFGVMVKALAYMLRLGGEGLARASEYAVLNANYLKKKLENTLDIPYADRLCAHEFVASAPQETRALDIAKALLDRGFHAPTIYFPLIVHECIMAEPTETESKETLDSFVQALEEIMLQAKSDPQALLDAPVTLPARRMDETGAARNMILTEDMA